MSKDGSPTPANSKPPLWSHRKIVAWLTEEPEDPWSILAYDEAAAIRRRVRVAWAGADMAAAGPYAAEWRAWANQVDAVSVGLLLDQDDFDSLERV